MDKVTKDVRESGVKKLFYADHMVLFGDNLEEVQMKKAMMEKGS